MPHPYDTLIIGAGPAGCAAAYDLAQAGRRVLLLDKRSFPRPKACACGLTRKTLAALRYSVDPIIERRCHEIVLQIGNTAAAGAPDRSHLEIGDSTALPAANKSKEVRVRNRQPIAAMAVRETFDNFCLQQTLNAGRNGGSAELKKIDHILAIREAIGTNGLPTHIELDIATPTGPETLTAPILIGADGSNGQTRRLVNNLATQDRLANNLATQDLANNLATQELSSRPESALSADAVERPAASQPADPAWYTRGFALEATIPYATLPAALPQGDHPHDLVFDFAPLPGGYGWLFPKAGHINIGVGAFAPSDSPDDPTNLKQVTRQLFAAYTLQKLGVPLDQIDTRITGQHLGMGGHRYTPQGRILLTGDAAGLVDPLTGEGIHSAIISGQAAAAAILETSASLSPTDPAFLSSIPAGNLLHPTAPETTAAAYARLLKPLQQTLAFSHRAAQAFYRDPERGFRIMRTPILRSLVLKTYADGLPHTKLLTRLAKLVA